MHCLKMHHSSDSSVSFFLRVWFWTQPMACVGGMVISLLLLWVIQTQKLFFFFLQRNHAEISVRCWSQGRPFQRLLFPSSVCMWHLGQRLNPLTQSSIQPQSLSAAGPWLTSVIHTHTHTWFHTSRQHTAICCLNTFPSWCSCSMYDWILQSAFNMKINKSEQRMSGRMKDLAI